MHMSGKNQNGLQAKIIEVIERNMSVQGVTGAEMSRRLNTSPSQIYGVLRGKGCNIKTLQSMLSVLGIGVDVVERDND
jgi:predicted transcriptional regulator